MGLTSSLSSFPSPGRIAAMNRRRNDIGALRREQIVAASAAIIAEQGLQHLSLSAIEGKIGMSRGQLMYWFKTKEDILLAVFDRTLLLMFRQHDAMQGRAPWNGDDWLEILRHVLERLLMQPPEQPEFQSLHYTFLSQIAHREDFRRRLADLYEHWRRKIAADVVDRPGDRTRRVDARNVAILVQAMLNGLRIQKTVDPDAFEPGPVIDLCIELFRSYLRGDGPAHSVARSRRTPARRKAARPAVKKESRR